MRYEGWLTLGLMFISSGLGYSEEQKTLHIKVDPTVVHCKINPLFFGVNIEFWLDDDRAFTNPHFLTGLKDLNVKLMRFPGGTESDNYVWNEKRLYNTKLWPFESGPQKTDTDEFMQACKSLGSEAIFVVNTEYSYFEKSEEKGAQLAADWVRYCREKGYHVAYWSVGNEAFWKPFFTAREYAELFVRYAKAMKEVDPSIAMGAIGPSDWDEVGQADQVSEEAREELIHLRLQEQAHEISKDEFAKKKNNLIQKYPGSNSKWWPMVYSIAGKYIDYADIHRYTRNLENDFSRGDAIKKISDIRKNLTAISPTRPIPIALTEWNLKTPYPPNEKISYMEVGLSVAEMIAGYINSGVDMGTYWPLTMKAGWTAKSLMKTNDTCDRVGAFEVFQLFANNATGESITCSSETDDVSTFAVTTVSNENSILRVFVSSRPTRHQEGDIPILLDISNLHVKSATGKVISATSLSSPDVKTTTWDVQLDKTSVHAVLPCFGVGMFELKL
jgi:alpha-L-arabinofuranosidase